MTQKKILLLAPPAYSLKLYRDINPLPPMGLGYIASIAEQLNHKVRILDCLAEGWETEEEIDETIMRIGLSNHQIKQKIKSFQPDIIGINCQFSRQHKVYQELFSLIKKDNPESIIIAGGAHATVCPQEVLSSPGCDFVVIGEGENSFKELLQSIANNRDYSHIDGLGWKTGTKIKINAKAQWVGELDALPFPAYHLMNLELYFGLPHAHGIRHKKRFMPLVTSRGCPAKCTFCTANKVWGNRYRIRSVDNVIQEMKLLKNTYNIEEIMFEDDNVTANPTRAKELFRQMTKQKLNFTWDTPNGVGIWSVDEEMLDLMKKSGCIKINFPVESGSQKVLSEIIKKPLNLTKVKKLISHCKKINLDFGMFLVVGMPGETLSDIWQSFKFAAKCGVFDPHISVATPYPGSELFENCKKENYFRKPFSFEDLFIRSYLIETKEWDEKKLRTILIKGKLYLYIRRIIAHPSYFFKTLKKAVLSPKRIISFLVGF
jgi:anaerobic magnesium-protoporphyrin IX monomethyl ester cyclase